MNDVSEVTLCATLCLCFILGFSVCQVLYHCQETENKLCELLACFLFKPYTSWSRWPADVTKSQRRNHFVIYHMIWWILLPLPVLLRPFPRPLPIASLLIVICLSNNHWRDPRCGGWRHLADTTAVGLITMMAVASLRTLFFEDLLFIIVLIALALSCYAVSWLLTQQDQLKSAMVCHLLFRYTGIWALTLAYADHVDLKLLTSLEIVGIHALCYWASAAVLWQQSMVITNLERRSLVDECNA